MADTAYADFVLEQLEPLGGASARRMFGGNGIYADDVMFAIIASDMLYFKVDDQTRADFEAAGAQPFVYRSKAKNVTMSYYDAPADALEDRREIERGLMCYCGCSDLTVRVCTCGTAEAIRTEIADRLARGESERAVVVLGSATPSLESYGRARRGIYQLLSLPERAGSGTLPRIPGARTPRAPTRSGRDPRGVHRGVFESPSSSARLRSSSQSAPWSMAVRSNR